MKKNYSKIIVVVFLAVLIFFTSFSVFKKDSEFSVNENRALQTMPAISAKAVNDGTFQQEYNDYLSDQFEFRDFWVKAKTNIMLLLGKKDMNGVYFGKDNYLIEKYSESDFDKETVDYNVETLTAFLNKSADDGFYVTCAFIPSKGTALKSKLPKYSSEYDTSYVVNAVKDRCSRDVNFVGLTEILRSHENEYIYYKTDHHWTSLGAYYAYRELMEINAKDRVLNVDGLKSEVVAKGFIGSTFDKVQLNHKGDEITKYETGVNVKVNFNGEGENQDSLYFDSKLGEKSKYEYFLGGNYARVNIKTSVKNDETLFLIKDSFSNALVPFLVNNYENIIMLDLRYFNGDVDEILEDEDVDDIFVVYNTEKFMVDENQSALEPYEQGEMTEEELENERILQELEEEERRQGIID